jgi:signal transduction histidine kinase
LKESNDNKEIDFLIDEIQTLLWQTIKDTRSLTFELSPPILYELGFESAIEWIGEKVSGENNITFEFNNDKYPKPVSEDVGSLLFRSVQELLTNIVKHSQASSVIINIQSKDDFVHIAVKDDGIGFDLSEMHSKTWKTTKFGLFSIKERIESIDGNINIESESGQGTTVTLAAPLKSH